jgi:hypothetical protein
VLAATVHAIVAEPVPDVGLMVAQVWLMEAVQIKAASLVVIDIDGVPGPPEAPRFADKGLTARTPADWVTVMETGEPWLVGVTVRVAVRGVPFGFPLAVYEMAPAPVPDVPPVRLNQRSLLLAVQLTGVPLQSTCIPLLPAPLPPAASTLRLLGLNMRVQGGDAASWLTVNVMPVPLSGVTVIVPVRIWKVLLTEAVHCTLPWPMPVPPEITLSQEAPLIAVHCREVWEVFTVMLPLPPEALTLADEGLMLNDPPV